MDEQRSPYRSTTTMPATEVMSVKDRMVSWLCSLRTQLYISHALSAWGDRWWMFSIGLLLVTLSPVEGSLRVTAINSITISVGLILFSHVIGYWIDLSPRLHVIRVSVLFQNACVVVTNVIVYLVLANYHSEGRMSEPAVIVYLVVIISFSVLGRLASVANKIAVTKDWIVVIAHAGHVALTDANAMMRRIDLVCNIAAPVCIGFLMTWASQQFAALFVAIWNGVSALVEYTLLVSIYTAEPMLSVKDAASVKFETHHNDDTDALGSNEQVNVKGISSTNTGMPMIHNKKKAPVPSPPRSSSPQVLSYAGDQGNDELYDSPIAAGESGLLERTTRFDLSNLTVREVHLERSKTKNESFRQTTISKLLFFFTSFNEGLQVFCSYRVKYASLALAMLYLTVLNFNSSTNGYMKLQGLDEFYLSLIMAASSVCGVLGTILFPFLKNWVGLRRATMCGSIMQIFCISLSVVSFFLPGSLWHMMVDSSPESSRSTLIDPVGATNNNQSSRAAATGGPSDVSVVKTNEPGSVLSVIVFACGIAFSRAGLWIFDLGVSQMTQETVHENERGKFSAFQQCLNSVFDLIYLVLVIILPFADTYAWLGFVSYSSVVGASLVLLYYIRLEGVTLCPCNSISGSKSNIHVHVPDDQLPPLDVQHENGLDSGSAGISTVAGTVSLMVNQNYTPVKQAEENC